MSRQRGGAPGSPGGGESRARAPIGHRRAANAIRQNGPRVGGNKDANPRARSPERGREPSAAWWSRSKWYGRGTCRRESLEWRAGDVSVPLPLPASDPFPAHRVRSGTASVIRAGPALRRGHSQPGRPLGPGLRRPCSRDPQRRHRPAATAEQPPPPRGFIAGPARGQNTRAPGGRAGERAAASGARRLFPGAAGRSQPPPSPRLHTGGLRAQDGSGPNQTQDTKGSPGKRDCGPATARPGICGASGSLV